MIDSLTREHVQMRPILLSLVALAALAACGGNVIAPVSPVELIVKEPPDAPLACSNQDSRWMQDTSEVPHSPGQLVVLGVSDQWLASIPKAIEEAETAARRRAATALNASVSVAMRTIRRTGGGATATDLRRVVALYAEAQVVTAATPKQCIETSVRDEAPAHRAYVAVVVDVEKSFAGRRDPLSAELSMPEPAKLIMEELRRLENMVSIDRNDPFWIDAAEVAHEAYDRCVATRGCTPATPYDDAFSDPQQPVVGVTFEQASAYCRAQGKRLPTPDEWLRAAYGGGPDPLRDYPWGETPPTCDIAHFSVSGSRGCGTGRPARVARYPRGATPEGAFDLGGNVAEYTAPANPPDALVPRVAVAGTAWDETSVRRRVCEISFATVTLVRGSDPQAICPDEWGEIVGGLSGSATRRPFPNVGFRCVAVARDL